MIGADYKSGSFQMPVYEDFDDYLVFQDHRNLNKKEMFDASFVDFMKWYKDDIHQRYSRQDFQAHHRWNFLIFAVGGVALLACYVYFHTHYPNYALAWGIPMFAASFWVAQKGELIHLRAHSPNSLTGWKWLDKVIDVLGLAWTGVSPSLFKRRHCAAHYNDVGNFSRLFSDVWITFDQIPVTYYLRPHLLLRFLFNEEFCREELLNRKQLAIEILGFYTYLGVMIWELTHGSYFLFVFNLIPAFILSGSQVLSAIIVHSGVDRRNSFESNGIMDPKTCDGLFKLPLTFYNLIGAGGIVNHAIHHAYPQVPLEIVNEDYERLNQHILNSYPNVRYNAVLTMKVHQNLLERLGPPNIFDYFVTFCVSVVALFNAILIVVGVNIVPPVIFELMLVDYRVYFASTKWERYTNWVTFGDAINLAERYLSTPAPNSYLEIVYGIYCEMKQYLEAHPEESTDAEESAAPVQAAES